MKDKSILGIILILLGLGFLLDQFNIISFNSIISMYWPVVLIILGIQMIFPENNLFRNKDNERKFGKQNLKDHIDEFAIISGLESNIESQEFKGGKVTAIMAGVELDLRDAQLYNNEAAIEINAVMSGVEIYVPENWKIEHSGTPILGEFSNKKRYKEDVDAPLLKINFSVIMGSIEIK